ncbi:hypothetical protein pdam_00023369 [Pocillopora damicornis]|uniref:C-type lectin domain-containing protein n=1 Tax=Pocillopora damicornis TaxID=46731 RepID=A0A3M6TTM8_POCDA|nr:C-type lectin domain family 17, member A-like [Pocillopora damicornis]RMX44679.1 hypothetical protein pdam_00023369 [Pocillopora damicornis]
MDLVNVYALIILGVDLLLSRTDGERLCSCYTFSKKQWSWSDARGSCKANNKILAVMESEQEWQFITNEIQNKTSKPNNEWFIGLEKNSTTNRWTWINGKSVTIDKWHKEVNNPDPDDSYGMIHKEYPKGFKGSLSTARGYLQRGWICEEETGIDQYQNE